MSLNFPYISSQNVSFLYFCPNYAQFRDAKRASQAKLAGQQEKKQTDKQEHSVGKEEDDGIKH